MRSDLTTCHSCVAMNGTYVTGFDATSKVVPPSVSPAGEDAAAGAAGADAVASAAGVGTIATALSLEFDAILTGQVVPTAVVLRCCRCGTTTKAGLACGVRGVRCGRSAREGSSAGRRGSKERHMDSRSGRATERAGQENDGECGLKE
jgi:hypothetical protein